MRAAACLFEQLQCAGKPGLVAGRHPDRFAWGRIGRQRKMKLLCVVQQAVFQQAFQNRLNPRRTAAQGALGQVGLVPGQRPRRHHGDHILPTIASGQGAGVGTAIGQHILAVTGLRVGVLAGGSWQGRGKVDDQGGHANIGL